MAKMRLVGRGKMTEAEKRAIADFYLAWGPVRISRTARQEARARYYQTGVPVHSKLIRRGLLAVSKAPPPEGHVYMTPQGRAVARMLTHDIRRRRFKIRRNAAKRRHNAAQRRHNAAKRRHNAAKRRHKTAKPRRNAGREKTWRVYEVGWKAPAFGRIVENLELIGAPDDVPLGFIRSYAAKVTGIPVKQVRLRETHKRGARWV